MRKKILVLGSSIALGVYVPAIILSRYLEKNEVEVDFCYLEDMYTEEKKEVLVKNKFMFHRDFKLARAAHAMPNRVEDTVGDKKKKEFIQKCIENKYDYIIVFSGFWIETIEELVKECTYYSERINCIHMDSVKSNSWKNQKSDHFNDIWLFNNEYDQVDYILDNIKVIGKEDRNGRIVIHGGGWGMGTYLDKIKELNNKGIPLDIIIYYKDEVDTEDNINRYFLLDPNWNPNIETKEFPRLMEFINGKWKDIQNTCCGSGILELIRNAVAIVSKPGGGTMLDSLMTSTPIILLDPLASYEKCNASLWKKKGFGVDYYNWINRDDKLEVIRQCTEEMLKYRKKLKIYGGELING